MPKIDADLHPALPIRQRLDDEFMLVMSREIGAVVFESVYDKFAFLGRKESGGCGVLPMTQMSRKETSEQVEGEEERTSCMVKYAIHATMIVAKPSSKNCATMFSPASKLEKRGDIRSMPTHGDPLSPPSFQSQTPGGHRTHPRQ